MIFMLEVNPNETMNFFDAFSFGGQTTLIGMATVFTVLVIIWGALSIFKLFLYDIPNNKKKIEEPAVTESKVHPTDEVSKDSSEIVAVIAAAIAAAEADSNGAKFKVVSFRRKR